MSEENNRQSNGSEVSDWRAQVEASLARITKQQEILNKLHLREEFRAAKTRRESKERAAAFEREMKERAAVFEREMKERTAAFERESAERKETLDYLVRVVRALGDKTFEHDDRLERAGAILSGDSANRTGT